MYWDFLFQSKTFQKIKKVLVGFHQSNLVYIRQSLNCQRIDSIGKNEFCNASKTFQSALQARNSAAVFLCFLNSGNGLLRRLKKGI